MSRASLFKLITGVNQLAGAGFKGLETSSSGMLPVLGPAGGRDWMERLISFFSNFSGCFPDPKKMRFVQMGASEQV
ncbi:hypothetical protein OB13_18395 [Pontibacter sp. HJ8]